MEKQKDELGNTIIIDLNQVEAIEANNKKDGNIEIKESNNRFNSMEDKSDKKSKVIMILVILGIIISLVVSIFLLNKYVFSRKEKSDPILNKKTELYNNLSNYDSYKDFYIDWVGVYKNENKDVTMVIYLDTDNSYAVSFFNSSEVDPYRIYNGIEEYFDDSLAGKNDYLYKEKADYYIKKNDSNLEVVFIDKKSKLKDKIIGLYTKEEVEFKTYDGIYKNINDTISIFTYDNLGNSIFVLNDSDKKEYKVGKSLEAGVQLEKCNFSKKDSGYIIKCKNTTDEELLNVFKDLMFERE